MEQHRPVLIHATAVALPVDDGWAGVLLRGAPGSGKSDLALRLIDEGARPIADDQTELCLAAATLIVRALAGHRVAAMHLASFEASASAKLRLATRAALAGTISDLDTMAAS